MDQRGFPALDGRGLPASQAKAVQQDPDTAQNGHILYCSSGALEDISRHKIDDSESAWENLPRTVVVATGKQGRLSVKSHLTLLVSLKQIEVPGAPGIQKWCAEREKSFIQVCDNLGIGRTKSDPFEQPRTVGLAGLSSAGKSTAASMVAAREDVRASFRKEVLLLPVNKGSKNHLSALTFDLAEMVYETVMLKRCRPPRKAANVEINAEGGAAYIRKVVEESSRRFLEVTDDVWEGERPEELKRARVSVRFTIRKGSLLPDAPLLRVDRVLLGALLLLVVDLARLVDHRSSKSNAVAVLPTGLAAPSEVAGILLCGDNCSAETLKATNIVLKVLERLSILAVETGGTYCVHEDHVDFVWDCLPTQQTSDAALPRWRKYISSVEALDTYTSGWWATMWDILAHLEGEPAVSSLYDATLYALDPSSPEFPEALEKAAEFHVERKNWLEAYIMYSQLCVVKVDGVIGDGLALAKILLQFGVCASDREGNDEDTTRLLRETLQLPKKTLEGDHPYVANTLHSLGVSIREPGHTGEAKKSLRQDLAFRKQEKLSDDFRHLERIKHLLDACTYNTRRLQEAEEELLQVVATKVKRLVQYQPEVANALYLGLFAHRPGRTNEGEKTLHGAFEIFEQNMGSGHLDVADALFSLGICGLEARGRSAEVDKTYRRALKIQEKQRPAHPNGVNTVHSLWVYIGDMRHTGEAEMLLWQALTLRKEKLSGDRLSALGVCVCDSRRRQEAVDLLRRAVTKEERQGCGHLNMWRTMCLGVWACTNIFWPLLCIYVWHSCTWYSHYIGLQELHHAALLHRSRRTYGTSACISRGKSATWSSSLVGVIIASGFVPGVSATETLGDRLEPAVSAFLRWLCQAHWSVHVLIVTLAGVSVYKSIVFSISEFKAGNAEFSAAWCESLKAKQAAITLRQRRSSY